MTDLENISQIHRVLCRLPIGRECPILASHAKELLVNIGAKMGLDYQAPELETRENSCKLTWRGQADFFAVEFYKETDGWMYRRIQTDLQWNIPQGQDKTEDIVAIIETYFSR